MKDNTFFDTNIILYSYSNTENRKCEIANKLNSEDMHHGLVIENRLKIENPYTKKV